MIRLVDAKAASAAAVALTDFAPGLALGYSGAA